MKKVNNIYDEELSLANIYDCYEMVRKARKNKHEVFKFNLNKNANVYHIYKSLLNENYCFSKYKIALITEPKYRLIMSEYLNDKIVNHFVAKYLLIKYLSQSMIDSNVATRENMGGAKGYKLFESYINKYKYHDQVYCLKIDIKKYFYNINHEVLFDLINKKIKDEKALKIIKNVLLTSNESYINETIQKVKEREINRVLKTKISLQEKEKKIGEIKAIPEYQNGRGLPIGNMTSQIMAIYYLNEVDHYIKNILRIKCYVRYMDDLVFIDSDKEKLQEIMQLVSKKIEEYKLEINSKSKIYDLSKGVEFLGYKYVLRNKNLLIKYNRQTIQRIGRRLKNLKRFDFDKYLLSVSSYKGYLQKSNSNLYKNKYEKEWSKDMKLIERSQHLKADNNDKIVIIKEGNFYKCCYNDAIILWHLFEYKINNDIVGFPVDIIEKVTNKLTSNGIGYIIVGDEEKSSEGINYENALAIAKYSYERYLKRKEIVDLLNECAFSDVNKYDEIINFIRTNCA